MAKDFIAYQKLVDAAPEYCNHHTDYVHHFVEAAIAHGANVFAILGAARLAQQQAEDDKRFNDAAIMTKLVELAGRHVDDCFRRGESVYGEDAENEYAAQQASSNEPDVVVLDNEPPPPQTKTPEPIEAKKKTPKEPRRGKADGFITTVTWMVWLTFGMYVLLKLVAQ